MLDRERSCQASAYGMHSGQIRSGHAIFAMTIELDHDLPLLAKYRSSFPLAPSKHGSQSTTPGHPVPRSSGEALTPTVSHLQLPVTLPEV